MVPLLSPANAHATLGRRVTYLCTVLVLRRVFAALLLLPMSALAAEDLVTSTVEHSDAIRIPRISEPIQVDGDLSDAAWTQASRVETWYETRPGDNVEPKVANVGYLAFDDEFLYAAFEFEDPEPQSIRAPLANRDNVPSSTDYGGLIVDATDDGKSAQMFLANPRGIQYDAISNDASGEDSAPDYFWDSAGRITANGWALEMRIPFSSLRYLESDPEKWGIMLYRNYPREYRYQMFTSRLPRESPCFICNVKPLVGLENLPSGSHWVVAPYVSGNQTAEPGGDLGTPLVSEDPDGELGLDAKWAPNPNTVLDVTYNPDFSQVESDVAQIAANERFALFFPEKRTFFLEGVDLLSTPIQAVYTRSFTSPRWGARATGGFGKNKYTLLVGEDRGGGLTIIPESNSSDFADQDFESLVAMGRIRRDIGKSFMSFLYTGREIDGGGSNHVFGPDFRWRPNDKDTLSGQLLFSGSTTPNRPDLADEWDGRDLSGHGAELWWWRQLEHWDFFTLYNDFSDGFRADNGFVPQVGFQRSWGEVGYTFYPEERKITRLRTAVQAHHSEDQQGRLLTRRLRPSIGLDAPLNSFFRLEFHLEDVRTGDKTFRRNQIRPTVELRPTRRISSIRFSGTFGDEVDFANDRLGEGTTLRFSTDLRPTDHLQVTLNAERRTVDIATAEGISGRLFTADVGRLRTTYTFNSRSWLRLIGQWAGVERDSALYFEEVDDKTGSFGASLLFAYKLNWQTVFFLGYGDSRELDDFDDLQESSQQIFFKVSYAFQG